MADSGLNWVRVSMDTGGIAAGADTVCTIFEKGVGTLGFGVDVRRVGSLGYSFADPLVEVAREGDAPRGLRSRRRRRCPPASSRNTWPAAGCSTTTSSPGATAP